jgi:ABC-type transport system involved in multi-copper enzyme maturation permease subunit
MNLVNFSKIWAVARMERRHTRRLLRYWVFLVIAYLFGLGMYIYYGVLHALFSSISASVGMIGPRYLMGAIGLYYLTGFVLGIVFLGFDIRARDVRESIVEVLDSRPLTNLELVAGRFIALFLSAWIPILVLVVLIQGLGWLLPLMGSPIGRMVEPISLFNFVVLMAMPAVAFAIALVFVITLLVRNRLIAALLSIAAVVGLYWLMFTIPSPFGPYVDFLGVGQVSFPTDIVPAFTVPGGLLQRIAFVVLAIGFVGIAAAIHPRLDGRERWRSAAGSAALLVVGLALLVAVSQRRLGEVARIEQWRMAHEARAGDPIADVVSIAGSVKIEPGRRIDADLQLELQAPPEQGLSRVLLTLNPGFVVDEVRSADGRELTAEHADGLLDIELDRALQPGEQTSLSLRYSGPPDTGFGYLDSAVNLETVDLNEAQIGLLGYERGIFDRRYVALTPGIRWLPASGVDVGADDARKRRPDFFRVALNVELPSDWLAAGPGKRQVVGSAGDNTTFRFAPRTSVPEVALMAAEFESFATEIEGVTFEVLVDPDHDQNFEVLAGARGEIEQWVAERLDVASRAGLAYPFDAFTIVEVPNTLRGYVGGWRLDTALAPPGMMLLRETSFPTARFDFDFFDSFGNNRNFDQEGGAARINRDRLIGFFTNDFSGGNLFTGAARSFFAHRTSPYGPDAIALEFALEELATLLVSGQRSYFSVHMFTNINAAATRVVGGMQGIGASSVADALITVQTSQTDVWDAALDTPLSDLDPWADPQRTIDILTLKGGKMAEAIYDTLGPERVGQLLANLLERHAGASFTLADLVAASDSVDANLGPLLEDWFESAGLPGFVAGTPQLYRLPDGVSGESRYQLLLRVGNSQPVTGFARVAWAMQAANANVDGGTVLVANANARVESEPIRIPGNSAIEFGVVLSEPPAAAYVHPYLALNRIDFQVGLLNTAEVPTRNVEPFNGVREVDLDAGSDDRIVADDLDDGFTIVTDQGAEDLRLAGRNNAVAGMDQGLPVAGNNGVPRQWSRRASQTAWGRYRHTLAYTGPGDGMTRAVMPASIPAPGVWELEIHQPFIPYITAENRGTWNIEIVSENGREPVAYDAAVGVVGWNLVGEFDLPAGEVRVELSDKTDGMLVIADAFAWSPVRVRLQSTASQSDSE